MPIHLFWGNDDAAREQAINALITEVIDPAWASINLTRLDGTEPIEANQALEEIRTPPFGSGGRVVLVQKSPFCNNCSKKLAESFEAVLDLIPQNSHLILSNVNKPDGRLKTTRSILKLLKLNQAEDKSFQLPAIWDNAGKKKLVERLAKSMGLAIEEKATERLVEAIGNDSSRLISELKKLEINAEVEQQKHQANISTHKLITFEAVNALVDGLSTNSLQIGDSLLNGKTGEALTRLNALLDAGEPALRIIATLTGQIRGWLWISLLEEQGERDVAVIAKAAGISNPKRIYVMRKQLQGRSPSRFLSLLSRLLEVEIAIKRGVMPKLAFQDGLLQPN